MLRAISTALFLTAASLIPFSAIAVIDPDPDQMGIFFDLTADNNCLMISPSIPFNTYVIYTNPTVPAISGYEFGLELDVPEGMESLIFRLSSHPYGSLIYPPDESGILGGDYLHGLAAPFLTSPSTPLHTFQYMLLTWTSIEFYLRGHSTPSIPGDLPIVFIADGDMPMQAGLSTGGPDIPVATVNTDCVVGLEDTNFGSVKALFR